MRNLKPGMPTTRTTAWRICLLQKMQKETDFQSGDDGPVADETHDQIMQSSASSACYWNNRHFFKHTDTSSNIRDDSSNTPGDFRASY